MTAKERSKRHKRRGGAFQMPSVQKMTSRKSSITNAFVNSILPSIQPTDEEVAKALAILKMNADNLQCAYCGNKYSEWDHLRPLVVQQRPTGYISEIANLVPACGKCNQSKRNQPWREWMISQTKHSPTGRGIPDVKARMKRLDAYERAWPATKLDFQSILGDEDWTSYWTLWKTAMEELHRYQELAEILRARIVEHVVNGGRPLK